MEEHAAYDTLYVELAEPARDSADVGQTKVTKAKETVDDDVEALLLEGLGVG